MARRKRAQKRQILPDPKFKDVLVAKFINRMMVDGKKSLAERIFYQSLDMIEEKLNENPLQVFKKAVENVRPHLEVRSRRVGGANYQIPIPVKEERQFTLASR
jgi:small subunit ribosomal protein S7